MAAVGSTRVVMAALACNGGIAAAKFAASIYTGSSAMLSEAVHSLIDTSNQALLLYGIKRAERPADARHPFGYAKELYFWSFVVAILLFSMGAGVAIYEGVDKLAHPHAIRNPEINYLVLGVAILLEGGSTYVALNEFNKVRGNQPFLAALRSSKDPAIFTVLLEDLAAMAGLFIALFGLMAAHLGGVAEADGMASIAIGLVLGLVAAFIAIEVKGLLTGEAASDELQAGVAGIIGARIGSGGVRKVSEIRTMQLGASSVLVAASLDVEDHLKADAVEALTAKLEITIKARYPEVKHLYLEVQAAPQPGRVEASVVIAATPPVTTPALAEVKPKSDGKPAIMARPPGGKQGRNKRRR